MANGVYHSILICIEREIIPAHQSQNGWGTESIPMMNKSELKKVRMSSVSAGDKPHLRLLYSCQNLDWSQFTYLFLPFPYFLPSFPEVTQICTYLLLYFLASFCFLCLSGVSSLVTMKIALSSKSVHSKLSTSNGKIHGVRLTPQNHNLESVKLPVVQQDIDSYIWRAGCLKGKIWPQFLATRARSAV